MLACEPLFANNTGIVLAADSSRDIALVDIARDIHIFSGDTAVLTKGSAEIARGIVSEVYSDSLRISVSGIPDDISGLEIQVIPSEETLVKRARKLLEEKFSGSFATGVDSHRREGNGNRSFYEHGFFFYHDLDLNYRDRLTENVNVDMNANIRVTDNRYYEIKNFSAKRLRLAVKEKDDQYGLVLGDEYTYFSHYTLSQSLKGVKAYHHIKTSAGQTGITAVFGVNKPRWDDFYDDQEFEAFQRYVSGVRIEQDVNEHVKFGCNFADSRDDEATSDSSGATPDHHDIFSNDVEVHLFDRFNARGEFAYAWTDANAKDLRVKNKGDLGARTDMDLLITDHKYFTSRSYYGYEYAGENFAALSGILKTDREEHYFRHKVEIGQYVSTKYQFNYFHNNTKDGLAATTKTRKHDLEFTIRPIPGHTATELIAEFYLTRRKSGDHVTTDNNTRSMYWKAQTKIKNTTAWGGYRRVQKRDDITLTSDRRAHVVDAGLKGYFAVGDFRFSPLGSVEVEQEANPTTRNWDNMVRLRLGCEIRGKNTNLRFYYLLRDENNQILGDVEERNIFDIEIEHYLFGDPSRTVEASFRRDDRNNKNTTRDYGEDIFTLRFTQFF
ncbi:MAG: hypothetical protein HY587_07350 [Candidatus Omnitrophica bacterium]|nr:hypothetical protein [Candidatus Omnitrophota bacterium]